MNWNVFNPDGGNHTLFEQGYLRRSLPDILTLPQVQKRFGGILCPLPQFLRRPSLYEPAGG